MGGTQIHLVQKKEPEGALFIRHRWEDQGGGQDVEVVDGLKAYPRKRTDEKTPQDGAPFDL